MVNSIKAWWASRSFVGWRRFIAAQHARHERQRQDWRTVRALLTEQPCICVRSEIYLCGTPDPLCPAWDHNDAAYDPPPLSTEARMP